MRQKLKIIVGILSLWFLIHSAFITWDGLSDNFQKADCILILGNKVNPDGTLSERLLKRVDKGLELYYADFSKKIIVSGGFGKEGFYEGTEMKKYLITRGVPEHDIIVDDKGNNTFATAMNFQPVSAKMNFHSVIVVSQFFHISRTKYMIKKLGFKQVYSAHADYFEIRDFYSIIREFFGFYQFALLGK
ncbi:MAG: YdcF family protein [Daejeonella sp.]